MSLHTLLRQTATHYPKSGYNKYGRDTSSPTGTNYPCRFQNKYRTKTLKEGEVIQILGDVYFMPDFPGAIEDRVIINGINMKLFSLNDHIDGRGNVRLIKFAVQKWQT